MFAYQICGLSLLPLVLIVIPLYNFLYDPDFQTLPLAAN